MLTASLTGAVLAPRMRPRASIHEIPGSNLCFVNVPHTLSIMPYTMMRARRLSLLKVNRFFRSEIVCFCANIVACPHYFLNNASISFVFYEKKYRNKIVITTRIIATS